MLLTSSRNARRAGIGLAAGAVTVVAFPITQSYRAHPGAIAIGSHPTNLWWPLASALGLVALVAAAPAVVRAARLRPQAAGEAGCAQPRDGRPGAEACS